MEKDVSLLRPFDLEAVKKGEPFCTYVSMQKREFINVDSNEKYGSRIIVRFLDGPTKGALGSFDVRMYRMEPITWLDGKPVYKDSKMYRTIFGDFMDAGELHDVVNAIKYGAVSWQKPSPVDPYAELKKAFAEGKTIQMFDMIRWDDVDFTPTWDAPIGFYRVKPEADPYAALKKAHAEGKTIQIFNLGGVWRDVDFTLSWNSPIEKYRVKPETKKYYKIPVENVIGTQMNYSPRGNISTDLIIVGDPHIYLVEE